MFFVLEIKKKIVFLHNRSPILQLENKQGPPISQKKVCAHLVFLRSWHMYLKFVPSSIQGKKKKNHYNMFSKPRVEEAKNNYTRMTSNLVHFHRQNYLMERLHEITLSQRVCGTQMLWENGLMTPQDRIPPLRRAKVKLCDNVHFSMNTEARKDKQIKLQQKIDIFPIFLLDIWSQEQQRHLSKGPMKI